MVFLAYYYNIFSTENIFCAVNAVIGGKARVVKKNILRPYALLQSESAQLTVTPARALSTRR